MTPMFLKYNQGKEFITTDDIRYAKEKDKTKSLTSTLEDIVENGGDSEEKVVPIEFKTKVFTGKFGDYGFQIIPFIDGAQISLINIHLAEGTEANMLHNASIGDILQLPEVEMQSINIPERLILISISEYDVIDLIICQYSNHNFKVISKYNTDTIFGFKHPITGDVKLIFDPKDEAHIFNYISSDIKSYSLDYIYKKAAANLIKYKDIAYEDYGFEYDGDVGKSNLVDKDLASTIPVEDIYYSIILGFDNPMLIKDKLAEDDIINPVIADILNIAANNLFILHDVNLESLSDSNHVLRQDPYTLNLPINSSTIYASGRLLVLANASISVNALEIEIGNCPDSITLGVVEFNLYNGVIHFVQQ